MFVPRGFEAIGNQTELLGKTSALLAAEGSRLSLGSAKVEAFGLENRNQADGQGSEDPFQPELTPVGLDPE